MSIFRLRPVFCFLCPIHSFHRRYVFLYTIDQIYCLIISYYSTISVYFLLFCPFFILSRSISYNFSLFHTISYHFLPFRLHVSTPQQHRLVLHTENLGSFGRCLGFIPARTPCSRDPIADSGSERQDPGRQDSVDLVCACKRRRTVGRDQKFQGFQAHGTPVNASMPGVPIVFWGTP